MKTYDLSGEIRKDVGKKNSKKLRKDKMVPCVMYGGDKVVHFAAFENEFQNLIYTPNVYLVNLDVGSAKHIAILQDFQFHPVTDKIIHADFIEVQDGVPVTVKLPIQLVGSSEGIRSGGKLRQRRRYLKVKGLTKDLPDFLEIDITPLQVGDVIKIGDLNYTNLELLDPPRAMVVSVVSSRLIAKGMREEEVEGVAEEAAEGAEAHEKEEAAE
ncbi:MAG: 50S ribosomal protein L25/general stress protein Ctc [Bacteroidales bacterium]|nr:50S ribosomal protein L25/general stress protein Ctc [Bacteroidales bacterium]